MKKIYLETLQTIKKSKCLKTLNKMYIRSIKLQKKLSKFNNFTSIRSLLKIQIRTFIVLD